MDVAPGSGHIVRIPLPADISPDKIDEFSLLVRYLPPRRDGARQDHP
jgi:hypothetical protein